MATDSLDIIVRLKDHASAGVRGIRTGFGQLGTSAVQAKNSIGGLYSSLLSLAAVLSGGALLGKSLKDFADFDDNMRAAGAVTSATTEELEKMTAAAQKMGRDTRYTASNAAESLRFLGMAGLSATESTAALPGVLNLAAAGVLDLGTAADITTNVLSAFGLEVENLGRVNDVLVKTFTSSNVNLIEIGEAFKMVGPIAKGVGSDFEDLVGAIGALGNAGIKGTLAGTALKGAIDGLLTPTAQEAALMKQLETRLGGVALKVKDAEGDFIGFKAIIEQLERAGLRGDEALNLFGLRAGPGMAALLNMGSASLDQLITKLREAGGTAKEIADKMEAGIGGELRKTVSLLESVRLAIGDAFGPELIDILVNFRNHLRLLLDSIKELKEDGTLETWGDNISWVMNKASTAIAKASHGISGIISLNRALISTLTGDFAGASKHLEDYAKSVGKVFEGALDSFKDAEGVTKEITQEMYDEFAKSMEEADTGPLGKGAKKVSEVIVTQMASLPDLETKLKAGLIRLDSVLKAEGDRIKNEYDAGLVTLEAYYDKRAEIIQRKIEAELNLLRTAASGESDPNKKAILNAQLFAKEQELQNELSNLRFEKDAEVKQLETKKLQREEQINALKLKAEKAYQDQSSRIKQEGVTELDAEFQKELADLQDRQNRELQIVKDFNAAVLEEKKLRNASELELEYALEEQKKLIREQQDLQAQERQQLIANQTLRAHTYQLDSLKQVASGTAQVFTQLYEITGKKSKEFFYLAKVAAIAEATMNVAQGVTKALAQGGFMGIAQGVIVAATGAAQIATIASQGLADGGLVLGKSPSPKADDKIVKVTSGEYVQPVSSVDYYGKGVMAAMKDKMIPRELFSNIKNSFSGGLQSRRFAFADGGLVGAGDISGGTGSIDSAGKQSLTIVNVLDSREMDRYLASSSGQDAVLNVLSTRNSEVKRILR